MALTATGTFNCEPQLASANSQRAVLSGEVAVARRDLTSAINRTTAAENEEARVRQEAATADERLAAMQASSAALDAVLGPLLVRATTLPRDIEDATTEGARQRSRNEAVALQILSAEQESETLRDSIQALLSQVVAS